MLVHVCMCEFIERKCVVERGRERREGERERERMQFSKTIDTLESIYAKTLS